MTEDAPVPNGNSGQMASPSYRLAALDQDFLLGDSMRGVRFLLDGDKVKVTVMYRGREMVHRELGRKVLDRVVGMLGEIAAVENPPRMEGRFLSMILVPKDTPGLVHVRNIPVMGHAGSGWISHAELEFQEVRVPVSSLLGPEGQGFEWPTTKYNTIFLNTKVIIG